MNSFKIFYSISNVPESKGHNHVGLAYSGFTPRPGRVLNRKGESMLKEYRTVYIGREAETVEKKSRFIATVQPVKTEEEALEFIEKMKKQYWNATHNCYAYVLGERFQTQRCSDDGEPQGTAGKPMLDVLLGEEIHDVAVVVTRYFGGTLLGTGGLVRAYSKSVQEGLLASKIITKIYGCKLRIETDYTGLGKIQYILGQRGITILDSEYTDKVKIEVLLPSEEADPVIGEITEGTNGQAEMEIGETCWFAKIDGEMKVFDN